MSKVQGTSEFAGPWKPTYAVIVEIQGMSKAKRVGSGAPGRHHAARAIEVARVVHSALIQEW